jgi:hypothetical protein
MAAIGSDKESRTQTYPNLGSEQDTALPTTSDGMRRVGTPTEEIVDRGATNRPRRSSPGDRHSGRNLLILASLSLSDKSHLQVVTHSKRPAPNGLKSNFAEIVHEMVCQVDAKDPTLMCWVADGEAFNIDPDHSGLGAVLSKYFQRMY